MSATAIAVPNPEPTAFIMVGAVEINRPEPQNIQVLGRKDAFITNLLCGHDWSRPYTSPEFVYPASYHAHQACTKCGTRRLFDTGTYTGGPLFREVIRQGR